MAHDLDGVTTARAVWDFTGGDARRFFDRVSLMKETAEGFLAHGAQLDFVRDGLKQTFKFNNPNVDATCGCGESVSFKSDAGSTAKD